MGRGGKSAAVDYDLIIVGAGAIGAAFAIEAGRLGYRTALIEARQPTYEASDPERVIALSHGSRLHLEALGVWDAIEAGGAGKIRHIRVNEPGQSGLSNLETDEARDLQPAIEALGYVVQMHHVLQPMHAALPDNVELIAPASVTSLHNGDEAVTVTLNAGKDERQLTARLLVGADGTESRIRSLVGITCRGWDHNRFGLVASVTTAHGHRDTAYECFRSTGPLAFLPLAGGRSSIVWSLAPREAADLMKRNDIEFIAALESAAGPLAREGLGRVMGIGKRTCYALESRVAASFAKGRVVLAGNAAHTLHPVAGQGMNLGLRDVAVLADVLSRALTMDRDPGRMILTQEYAERRRLDTTAVVGFTEGLLHTFEPDLFPAGWLRGRGLDALDRIAPLRRFLLGQAAGIGQLPGLRQHAKPGGRA